MIWNFSDSKDPLDHFIPYYGKVLFDNPDLAVELFESFAVSAKTDALTKRKFRIISFALFEARYHSQHGHKRGAEFFETLERQLDRILKENDLASSTCLLLSKFWLVFGLKPPESLGHADSEIANDLENLAKTPELVDAYRKQIERDIDLQKSDAAHVLKECYRSIFPTLPTELRRELARVAVSCDHEAYATLGCSLLLMNYNSVNSAVIDGFHDRLQTGKFSAALVAKLIAVRSLTNDTSTIAGIDQLVKDATDNGLKVIDGKKIIKYQDIKATYVDTSGTQAVVSTFQNGKTRYAVKLNLTPGLGIDSVDLVQCDSAAIQKKALEKFQDSLLAGSLFDVSIEYINQIISVALHDGYQNKIPPTDKVFELVQVMGLSKVNPMFGTLEDLLASVDPDNRIASKSSKEFARLIADSAAWEKKLKIVNGWYQTDDPIKQVLKSGKPKQEIWPILDSNRTHWAMCIGRTAMLLKEVNDSGYDSFVAVLIALVRGWDLDKIPAMKKIFNRTVKAYKDKIAAYEAVRPNIFIRKPTIRSKDYMKFSEIDILLNNFFELFPSPAKPLPSRIWLQGYFAAIQTVPAQIPHHHLLNELLERLNTDPDDFDDYDYERLADLLFLAVESTGKSLSLANDNHLLQLEKKELAKWVSGYLAVWKAFPMYWPDELLGKAGRQAKTTLEDAKRKKLDSEEALNKLFQWLCKCCEIRKNSNIPPPGISVGESGAVPWVMTSL